MCDILVVDRKAWVATALLRRPVEAASLPLRLPLLLGAFFALAAAEEVPPDGDGGAVFGGGADGRILVWDTAAAGADVGTIKHYQKVLAYRVIQTINVVLIINTTRTCTCRRVEEPRTLNIISETKAAAHFNLGPL